MYNKHVIYEEPGIELAVEINATGNMMLHFDINTGVWGITTYRRLRTVWKDLHKQLAAQGVEEIYSMVPDDSKTKRFQEMFDMTPLLDFSDSTLYRSKLEWA